CIALLLSLRDGEVAGAAPPAGIHARRAAVDHRAARVEIDHQPRAADAIVLAVQLHVTDQRDQLVIEIVDPEIATCRLRWAFHHYAARSVEPPDLDVAAAPRRARISDRQPWGVERHLGLRHVDVSGEDRP